MRGTSRQTAGMIERRKADLHMTGAELASMLQGNAHDVQHASRDNRRYRAHNKHAPPIAMALVGI